MKLCLKKSNRNKDNYIFTTQALFFLLLLILALKFLKPDFKATPTGLGSTYYFLILIFFILIIGLIKFKKFNLADLLINVFFIIITSILLVNEQDNMFKILFLMPVVVSGLKYSRKITYCIVIFIIIVLIIIGYINSFSSIDLDIVLSGVFFLIAWLLTNMTETENKIRCELERLATYDGLTDIYNHRSFQNLLEENLEKAKKENKSVCLMLMDIDYFKVYNDSFGHQKGDQALIKIASILKNCTIDAGYCARYGGEEFAVILPKIGIKRAKELGEKIRQSIEKTQFPGMDVLPKGKLTVSVGIAEFPQMADTKEKLVQKADEALYKAKFTSKNKVETYYSFFDELSLTIKDEEKEIFNSIRTLTMVINAKDKYTYGHSERTMELAKNLAKRIGLDLQSVKDIIYGALLHDIGKIEISREVLNKPTKLNEQEWEMFKQHPQWGADMIRPIKTFKSSLDIILYHHENYDGTGYPQGLKGEEIPYGARILRIVDSFDAMTSNRPYKEAMSKEQAIEELQKYSGIHYDSLILDEFTKMISENIN